MCTYVIFTFHVYVCMSFTLTHIFKSNNYIVDNLYIKQQLSGSLYMHWPLQYLQYTVVFIDLHTIFTVMGLTIQSNNLHTMSTIVYLRNVPTLVTTLYLLLHTDLYIKSFTSIHIIYHLQWPLTLTYNYHSSIPTPTIIDLY